MQCRVPKPKPMRHVYLLLCLVVLAACEPRTDIITAAEYDSLKVELEYMAQTDQKIRDEYNKVFLSKGFNRTTATAYLDIVTESDSANRTRIEEILERYGWPEKSKIGEKASEAIFIVVQQHPDTSLVSQYLPALEKLAAQGEASTIHCAMLKDRLLMERGRKQIYGTQLSDLLRPDKKMAIWPVEDTAVVNELRKKAGFKAPIETVEDYARFVGVEYDPAQELPFTYTGRD